MTTLYVPIGVSASGKSTVAKKLDATHVSSDAIRRDADLPPGASVWEKMNRMTLSLLAEGRSVTYDATNLKRTRRVDLVSKATRKVPGLKVVAILVLASERDILERNAARDTGVRVPDNVIAQQLRAFRLPMRTEGYDQIDIVRTSTNTDIPDQGMLSRFDQQNPHHTLTLGDHMTAVRDETLRLCRATDMEDHEVDDLVLAAAWHDIGKLRTKTFRCASGRPSDIAHYYGHENVGAHMMMAEILPELMPDADTNRMLRIATLVEWHMRPYFWNTGNGKAQRRDDRFLTKGMRRELEILHTADVTSH